MIPQDDNGDGDANYHYDDDDDDDDDEDDGDDDDDDDDERPLYLIHLLRPLWMMMIVVTASFETISQQSVPHTISESYPPATHLIKWKKTSGDPAD